MRLSLFSNLATTLPVTRSRHDYKQNVYINQNENIAEFDAKI